MWKILIVDDEAIEREALQEILSQKLGYEADIRTARDGQSAVEIATIWRADIILLDIEMPGTNGLQAAAAIRRTMPNCQIVFLTAYGLFHYAQEAIRLGVSDYLLKPAEDDEVLSAVQKAMRRISGGQATAGAPPAAGRAEPAVMDDAAFRPMEKNAKVMQQVQLYLEQHYQQDISLDGLAQTLDFSPFYFSKLFKQHFGVTFVAYLTEIRIRMAKQLLADPTKSVKDVGEAVGYQSSSYFVSLFTKKVDMSPTEYRNSL